MKLSTPQNKYYRFLFFFFEMMLSFFVVTANIRALAIGLYVWTAVTDTMIVFQNMIIGKLIIEDEKARDYWSIAGSTLGGACGSCLSIWATKHFFGG
jgi:hypothetical protein